MASTAFGQGSQELKELVNRALEENYQVLIFRNQATIAANNNTAGNAGMLPIVSLQGTRSNSVNNTVQRFFNGDERQGSNAKSTNLNGTVRVDWTIFDGFGMFARRDQLGLLEEMGQVQTRFYIEQTISDIADLYYQLVGARMRLDNFIKTLEVSRFRYNLEKKKLDFGSSNALLYNQALIDYNSDSLLVIEQQRLIKSLEIGVNRIINADPDADVRTSVVDIEIGLLDDKQTLFASAVENNRQLDLVEYDELIAETNKLIQKSDLYPQVSLFSQYSYNRSTSEVGFAELNRSFGLQYGVSVRFNLFNGFNERRELKNAIIQSENSSITTDDITAEIKSLVLDLYYQHESLQKQLSIAEENVTAAEKSQFIAREQYEKQAISGYDFRLTQLSVINAYNSAIQTRMNLKRIEIQLDWLTGNLGSKFL